MEQTRRFVFRGNAAAYSGQVYRRDDQPKLRAPIALVSGATSSLTVVGGQSSATSKSAKFLDGFVRIGAAGSSATSGFDDFKQAVLMSRHEALQESLTATTKVTSWVEEIVLGKEPKALKGMQPAGSEKEPRLRIGRISGSLTSSSGKPGDEPPIRVVGRETDVKEVYVDGYKLLVTLNKAEFESLDTMSKLQMAANDQTFIERTGDCMFRRERAAAAGTDVTRPDVVRPATKLEGTIVRSLDWAKEKNHPTAKIDHHRIIIPDFGIVYFGEIIVTSDERRLTMLRVEFGSPTGGAFACSEADTNGSWGVP
jgi:hypothetical protein